ncbi:hypothetical protein CARUB_v10016353mg [Capsella rubella]|uniref:F-box domain-containing protein n=1 Tax=Capsella rubella TaxID=81985 RepID=R0GBE5_9BRAS|nr:F-box protein At2g14710 [Capsella rubella]EOA33022.1 hypothetical protein CARUB_v10016353mg [Capsella rubella]
MAHLKNLPWELIEEILSRVPPKALVRFRAVSKQWNALFEDKRFMNNHKKTFRFIIATKRKIYSVSIDPVVVVRELPLGTPGLRSYPLKFQSFVDCNDLLLCRKERGVVVWNPWLGQSIWIQPRVIDSLMVFNGIVCNNKKYKMVVFSYRDTNEIWTTYDFSLDKWVEYKSRISSSVNLVSVETAVSLNGTLYWVYFSNKTDPLGYHISKFDFSRKIMYYFCNLPCGRNHDADALVLRVFRGDWFSLLKQCIVTKKIDIWVTKDKINSEDGSNVGWMNYMSFSSPKLPDLVETVRFSQPSYFIEGKRLAVCSCDNNGQAWIYLLEDDKLISKTCLDDVVSRWPLHCTFVPSLVQVPAARGRLSLSLFFWKYCT